MSDAVIVALFAFAGTVISSVISYRKTSALIEYRLGELEKKVDHQNEIIDEVPLLKKDVDGIHKDIEAVHKDIDSVHKDIEKLNNRVDKLFDA